MEAWGQRADGIHSPPGGRLGNPQSISATSKIFKYLFHAVSIKTNFKKPGILLFLVIWGSFVPTAEGNQRRWTSFAVPPSFEHLAVEHGLSQNSVHCILQDRKGFLWFGTEAGLNRYDGQRFQVFHPEKGNPNSLSSDWILHLLEDRRGYLWIATRNGGVTILDPESMVLMPVPASSEPGGLPSSTINKLAEDHEGNVWLATETQGLCMVPADWKLPQKPRFRTFEPRPGDPRGAPEGTIKGLFCDAQGVLWFGSQQKGLGRLSLQSDGNAKFEYYPHEPSRPETSAPPLIHAIQEDAFGLLWLAGDNGPFTFDPAQGTFRRWRKVEGETGDLGKDRALDILRDRTDTLWVASDGSGLLKVLPRSRREDPIRFQRFLHDPKSNRSLSGNGLQCVFEDRSGVLWVSSYQNGLNKLILNPGRTTDRERPAIAQYRNNAADLHSLSGNTVSAIGEDGYGQLWIGTDGFGLNRVKPSRHPGEPMRFERFREDPQRRPGKLQSDVILTMHLDPRKRLWLGTYNAGLVRVDQDAPGSPPRFVHFRNNPSDPGSLSSNFIRSIVDDGQGGFWVATDGYGLNHFDPRTGKARRYGWGKGPRVSSDNVLYLLARDAFGTLWIATPTGLIRFNPVTEEFRTYRPGGTGSLNEALINTLLVDPDGVIWVGTCGGGLNKALIPPWEGPEPVFSAYGVSEGLPGNVIMGILPDGKGTLWLSTDRALCRFQIQEGKAYPFTWHSELRQAGFIWNARFINAAGEMLFGSNNGLTVFHPEDLVGNPIVPPIAITGFQIHNKALSLWSRRTRDSAGGDIREITLGPDDSSFAFDFAALHYAAPERNQCAYRMEGLDSYWNEAGGRHSISYTTLPPGRYTLRIKGSNCDGLWNEQGLKLKIQILPPWYKTWWFQLTLVSAAGAGLFLGTRWYLRTLRRRNAYLEQAMAEQAARLHEAETLNALNRLTETATDAGEDIRRWVADRVEEVSRAVNATQIDVWEVAEEGFLPVTQTAEIPPCDTRDLARMDDSGLIPILGPHGETLAALKIHGKEGLWTPLESQLLASFTHQLSGAYHLRLLRQTLMETRQQKMVDRRALAAQGQGVLQICPACRACYDEHLELCPRDGSPLGSPRLLPYRLLGRYRLERLLGEGGTAHVFEAWDETLNRSVAVKAIKPSNFLSDQARERFAREASLLARLDHPGIVAIHDSRELEDGTVFLVMERLKGMTVGRLLRRHGPARPGQAAFLLRQVSSALASTHAKGLVHRDLKPENLFALAGGEWMRYKVLDFGLAKAEVAETGFTQTGALMGTPSYMSPEQARGHAVDWRSDLYSLAAILYEVISGTPVIKAKGLAEILLEVLSGEPIPLRTLLPDCPEAVDTLIMRGLAKTPAQRPEELLAWSGRLDVALQSWTRRTGGWPDRCEEETGEAPGTPETDPNPAPSTL